MHTPASSRAIRPRPPRSTPGGGRWGSSRRTGAMHHRCCSRRLATQRRGGKRVPGNSPSSRSAASSWSASGATSSELAARRRSRPRGSASHTLTARPPRVMAARRSTSCHNGSGPLESAGLMKSEEGRVVESTPLVRLQVFPPAVNCRGGATPSYASVASSCSFLFSVGNPDVLDLRRLSQEFPPFAMLAVVPVPRLPLDPRPLHVSHRRPLDLGARRPISEIPHRVHVVVLGEHFRERVFGSGDD